MSSVQPTQEAISRNFETMPVTQNQASCYGAAFLLGMCAGAKLSTFVISSAVIIPFGAAAGAVVVCVAVIFHRNVLAKQLEKDFIAVSKMNDGQEKNTEFAKLAQRGHVEAQLCFAHSLNNHGNYHSAFLYYKQAANDIDGTNAQRGAAAGLICALPDDVRGFESSSDEYLTYLNIWENREQPDFQN